MGLKCSSMVLLLLMIVLKLKVFFEGSGSVWLVVMLGRCRLLDSGVLKDVVGVVVGSVVGVLVWVVVVFGSFICSVCFWGG